MSEPANRKKAYRKGFIAEYIAAMFLLFKGYRICALRHKTKLGEIDIIAKKGDLAIFVEVKARKKAQTGIDAVSHASQSRIKNASDLWLAKQRDAQKLSQRYDIIVITPTSFPAHFLDAF
ncbi:YraN family protein [Lentilitoribacter sp. EG35]|uniref:YraN family protein n=1 Tax=Lentilitoribacter sp. EG35 TaxID=3234192 RepID=UPI00345F215E